MKKQRNEEILQDFCKFHFTCILLKLQKKPIPRGRFKREKYAKFIPGKFYAISRGMQRPELPVNLGMLKMLI